MELSLKNNKEGGIVVWVILAIILILLLIIGGIYFFSKKLSGLSNSEDGPYGAATGQNCENLAGLARDGCWQSRATSERDIRFCEFISVPQNSRLSEEESRLLVIDVCINNIAKITKDISFCDMIHETEMRENCKTLVTY